MLLRLAARACAPLQPDERVWLSPALASLRDQLARSQAGLRWEDGAVKGSVHLALALFDELRPGVSLPRASRVVAVGRVFARDTLSAVDWAQRAGVVALELASPEGTLALCEGGGLVVTGLVDGLSARDLQDRLSVPLLAGPGLRGLPAL